MQKLPALAVSTVPLFGGTIFDMRGNLNALEQTFRQLCAVAQSLTLLSSSAATQKWCDMKARRFREQMAVRIRKDHGLPQSFTSPTGARPAA
jgi:hypothetical protein